MRHAKAGGKEEVRGVKSSIPHRYAASTFEGHIMLAERSPTCLLLHLVVLQHLSLPHFPFLVSASRSTEISVHG